MRVRSLPLLVLLLGCCVAVSASAAAAERAADGDAAAAVANRRMLVCCGLPGDDRHREQMTAAIQSLITTSQTVLAVPPDQLTILAGDEVMQTALQPLHSATGICTRETLETALAEAAKTLKPSDAYWVLMIGHSHPYGAESQFNVAGPDINQSGFAQAAAAIECREQVYWLTQPLSGFWIKPLARPGRIIITATEADLEFTGTEMPYALAAVLDRSADTQSLDDIDGDGTLSLLDLYLATNLEINARFRSIDRLQTEHAQLDDNGDGRGSEVQQPYLPVESDEEEEEEDDAEDDEEGEEDDPGTEDAEAVEPIEAPKPALIQSQNLDGFRSRYVLLEQPASE
ncbi:hypothetical protein Enr13x_77020 [Stieleria neptunia]|uniref:Caspase domain protein n=1 Tax=Stieleria neptunia TaxID=2527979 RepID=A0A518I3W2_9BACT|nr:hypothetical protein [Stieleria neptunia]QDV47790.1 hypothetical protein Enr13x_77020 [Stieleria neptunia]